MRSVDVTDDGGQFCDREKVTERLYLQKTKTNEKAKAAIEKAEQELDRKIVTPIIKLEKFYIAEDYHQDYYKGENFVLTRFGPRKQSNAYKLYRNHVEETIPSKSFGGLQRNLPNKLR